LRQAWASWHGSLSESSEMPGLTSKLPLKREIIFLP
jgi:hypothetical protein